MSAPKQQVSKYRLLNQITSNFSKMTDRMIVKVCIVVMFCLLQLVLAQDERESRKLFGGYKITPRFCRPTRRSENTRPGPNICMFNHECASRQGTVVGACMDGFLFGACCNLPGITPGELLEADQATPNQPQNNLEPEIKTTKEPNINIMSNGFSELTLTTAGDNDVVQLGAKPDDFVSTGVTHPVGQETYLLNNENNEIQPLDFSYPPKVPQTTERGNIIKGSTPSYSVTSPLIQIAISHTPGYYQKPMFRPKPTTPKPEDEKYVLVPTITHQKPNKTQEFESIVNIIQMLNESSTTKPIMSSYGPSTVYVQTSSTKKPPSTSYVFSTNIPKRPTTKPAKTTSRKPPSTSYVFSTVSPPRRTTIKKPTAVVSIGNNKPTKRPTTSYYSSSSVRPTSYKPATHKPGTNKPTPSKRPKPTTSYIFSSSSTKKPVQTATVIGPSFSVATPTKTPYPSSSNRPSYSPTPNIIVISPVTAEPPREEVTNLPPKPVTQVTINNIVTSTNNYHYSTSQRPPRPTVHITPKPPTLISTNGYIIPVSSTEYGTIEPEIDNNNNDLNNFPPVRNPNLNMSASIVPIEEDLDFTTPVFEDEASLNKKVDTFVSKIVLSLQEPFNELKDIVYNKNRTTTKYPTTKKPLTTKKPTRVSTPKPVAKPQKPTNKPGTSRPVVIKITTKRPTTIKKPTVTTKRPVVTTSKKPKPIKRPITPPPEDEDEDDTAEQLDYRRHCGVRPLMKTGRIVGGKGATFGEWPWQVLVRESTWLGLFTKNKCGGVLISQRYVVTAAHCQPGFLASLVAVFGEYDISGELESKRSMSKNVRRVVVHRQYDAATFENDLALLELESPVQYDQHIVPICLPQPEEDFTGRMATVTGWGRLKYGGGVPSVLQEVQVPIMENPVCQEMFRTAGHSKVILDSFLCAGYANGQKDSCEGDSGGPLVLQRSDGRFELAGTVSHGIKCAAPYLPGVYMRTTYFKPWLESITGVH